MFALLALTLLLHTRIASTAVQTDEAPSSPPRCVSDVFTKPQVGRGVTILSVHARSQHNFTSIAGGPLLPSLSGLNFCQVQIYLTHQTQNDIDVGLEGTDDKVLVEVWLPLAHEDWNGRLQATGGAGFATGMFGAQLGVAVKDGWAAVSTDGGHSGDLAKLSDTSWAIPAGQTRKEDRDGYRRRQIRWNLLHNFASRSSIDQILIGKAIIEQYYQTKPHHSYWNGCSTGGRQGYAIAQKYPELLDGILAVAPAISFIDLLMGELWPQTVMNNHKTYLSNCEFEYFRVHAILGCQVLEQVKNGIVEKPDDCHWNASQLIGQSFECDGQEVTITKAMAAVVDAIRDGPGHSLSMNQFPGLAWPAPVTTLANITVAEDGTRSPNPFKIANSLLHHLVAQDVAISVSTLDTETLNSLWVSIGYELSGLLNTDDPDLTRLRDSGTKLLTWHGTSDQMIPFQNTVNYRRKVEGVMGGAHAVDEYYRLFLAPGVEHCGGGIGPIPRDPLDALVRWVEEKESPETLDAETIDREGELVTKELCLWPAWSEYMGIGDSKRASTWTCNGGTQRPVHDTFEPEPWMSTEYRGMQKPQISNEKEDRAISGSHRAGEILGGLKDRIEGLGLGLRVD